MTASAPDLSSMAAQTPGGVQQALREALGRAQALSGLEGSEPGVLGAQGADAAATPAPPPALADPTALLQALTAATSSLQATGSEMALRVLGPCLSTAARLADMPETLAPQAAQAIARALQALLAPPAGAEPGTLDWALGMFAPYSAVAHLAGAQRVHPADLWPVRTPPPPWPERSAPPCAAAPELIAAFEEALLALMRQQGADSHRRMSDLCASLAAGPSGATSAVWHLAGAAYEALADDHLRPDVHLKRLGSRLLALLRGACGVAPAVSSETQAALVHELLFVCARACEARTPAAGTRLAEAAHACGLAPAAVSPLAQRVAGLPSMADLDPAQWTVSDVGDEDAHRVIGPLRLNIGVFNRFLNEADERARRLRMVLSEWVLESVEGALTPPWQAGLDARWLADESARIGHADLADFAAVLAEAVVALQQRPEPDPAARSERARCLDNAARDVDRALHQFAAGFLKPPSSAVLAQLRSIVRESATAGAAGAGLGSEAGGALTMPGGLAQAAAQAELAQRALSALAQAWSRLRPAADGATAGVAAAADEAAALDAALAQAEAALAALRRTLPPP